MPSKIGAELDLLPIYSASHNPSTHQDKYEGARIQFLLNSMSRPQKTFRKVILIFIEPIVAQFDIISPKQPLDKYEGGKIPFRQKNKLLQSKP